MSKSIAESNAWGTDLHMPIHTNAGGGSGTMCMVYSKASENMKYAEPIYKAVQAVTPGRTEYGIREYPELGELNGTNCIAVYTEVDFHDNKTIAKWIIENVKTIGEAFAKGVCQAFGVTYKAEGTTTTSTAKTNTAATISDRDKFLNMARSYAERKVNGYYVCKTKLGLPTIVDWCAYAVSAIMKDCGFIGKYQGGIYGYASDNAREDNGKYGTWFKKGDKAPQPGDLIMFRYASFINPLDKYSASHVGIVEAVAGNAITTLEGNVDATGSDWAETSTFKRKTRYLSDSSVYSFYRFNWETPATSATAPTTGNLYRVQVGAFSDKKNAQSQLDKIKKAGFDGVIVESKK